MKVSGKYQVGWIQTGPARPTRRICAGSWSRLGESNPRPIRVFTPTYRIHKRPLTYCGSTRYEIPRPLKSAAIRVKLQTFVTAKWRQNERKQP